MYQPGKNVAVKPFRRDYLVRLAVYGNHFFKLGVGVVEYHNGHILILRLEYDRYKCLAPVLISSARNDYALGELAVSGQVAQRRFIVRVPDGLCVVEFRVVVEAECFLVDGRRHPHSAVVPAGFFRAPNPPSFVEGSRRVTYNRERPGKRSTEQLCREVKGCVERRVYCSVY